MCSQLRYCYVCADGGEKKREDEQKRQLVGRGTCTVILTGKDSLNGSPVQDPSLHACIQDMQLYTYVILMCILIQGIVVKVLHKRLGQRFYKKKGVVQEVKDLYTGIV